MLGSDAGGLTSEVPLTLSALQAYSGAIAQLSLGLSIDLRATLPGAGGTMSGGSSSLLQHETAAPGTAG